MPSLHPSPPQDPISVCPPAGEKVHLLGAVAATFVELFYKLLDLPALTRVVMCGVVHHASRATIIATRCLMGELLVISWA
jgi:hypothetical protein